MVVVPVGALSFVFEPGWEVGRYDDWAYYKSQFQKVRSGIKAIDVLALAPDKTLYLIEVKDYRQYPRTKPSELDYEVCCKILDTLAGILPAKVNARIGTEKAFAAGALAATTLRVILHLEQPAKRSRLRPRAIDPSSVQIKLRQRLKAIDAHPEVHERGRPRLRWTVS